jgi:hypothetical protein
MLLGLGVCYYNDRECLKRLIKSIYHIIPHDFFHDNNNNNNNNNSIAFIGVDGKFYGYGSEAVKSTDGSYELIEEFKKREEQRIKVINTVTPTPMREREKRQLYVDIAAKIGCEFLIVIDADDYFGPDVNWNAFFEQELPRIRKSSDRTNNLVHYIKSVEITTTNTTTNTTTTTTTTSSTTFRPRLWYKPELLHYTTRHYVFERRDKIPVIGESERISEDVMQLYHNPNDCRCHDRLEKRRVYSDNLEYFETH